MSPTKYLTNKHETIEEPITGVPQYLGYFHAGIFRSVLMYVGEDSLNECYWQLLKNGLKPEF